MQEKKEIRQILRIAGVDLDGDKSVNHQLTKVKGVSVSYSNMICCLVGIPKLKKAGDLSDDEIKRIEEALGNPQNFGAPSWMVNRQKDPETGENIHLIGSDLKFIQDNDIKLMKKTRSYKGVRHSHNLPVRGQRTKSNFRKNKGKVQGVTKGKNKPAAAPGKK